MDKGVRSSRNAIAGRPCGKCGFLKNNRAAGGRAGRDRSLITTTAEEPDLRIPVAIDRKPQHMPTHASCFHVMPVALPNDQKSEQTSN